jgi:hypothetical protein
MIALITEFMSNKVNFKKTSRDFIDSCIIILFELILIN